MPRIEVIDSCQLEWDKERGVLYVHNTDTGATLLRIQGLPVSRPDVTLLPAGQIDIHCGLDKVHVSVP